MNVMKNLLQPPPPRQSFQNSLRVRKKLTLKMKRINFMSLRAILKGLEHTRKRFTAE